MEKLSIRVTGEGFVSEGDYKNIKIIGSSKSVGNVKSEAVKVVGDAEFEGNLEFKKLKVMGEVNLKGSIKSDYIKVNGNIKIDGTCNIDNLVINGDCEISDEVRCNNVTIRGELKLNKNIYAKEIKVYGSLSTCKNIECENIKVDGIINCDGLLNSEKVLINPRDDSYCREIGASHIEVKSQKKIGEVILSTIMFSKGNKILKTESIEADYIEIERIHSKVVRGRDVYVKDKCIIENLDYSSNYEASNKSTVKNYQKIN